MYRWVWLKQKGQQTTLLREQNASSYFRFYDLRRRYLASGRLWWWLHLLWSIQRWKFLKTSCPCWRLVDGKLRQGHQHQLVLHNLKRVPTSGRKTRCFWLSCRGYGRHQATG
jgi:hypothetical protein